MPKMDIDKLIQLVETEVKKALTDQVSSEGKINSSKKPPVKKSILALFTGGYTKFQESITQFRNPTLLMLLCLSPQ
jgi:hypothetical protein